MYSNGIIKKISISNFRSHKDLTIESNRPNVVLFGENGAGKTNILEAITMFSPGKGMRDAKHDQMINNNENINSFQIKILLNVDQGDINFHKKYLNDDGKSNINYFIDDKKINNNDLLNYIRIIWITPVMEKVMLQNYTEKRNFFDRLIFNINKKHLKNCRNLTKLLKERISLLQQDDYDENWLSILEEKIATYSFEVLSERKKVIKLINENLKYISEPFTSCNIRFSYRTDKDLFESNDDEFKYKYREILKNKRYLDKEISRTTVSVNSVNFDIYKSKGNNMDAKNCSTGEQKSMLISIILSVCSIIKKDNSDTTLIILIDEAMAHFDEKHREQLFYELALLNSQVWYTGVSKDLFKNISEQTDFFEIKNNI
jgi:DNA replication and repair protein RecF